MKNNKNIPQDQSKEIESKSQDRLLPSDVVAERAIYDTKRDSKASWDDLAASHKSNTDKRVRYGS